ncbi:hypothetical protein [Kitasatospora sp. NPDC094011]|uniref:hypothetical protein n=1 Tax=Kitasatospora sp. NPDC094011 TaxID=3364090 RepID=UPI00382D9A73
MTRSAVRHPLAVLREGMGLSHGGYARLVAETHAELGYGRMAERREKVARWESGRIVPELTAQLAIAQVHSVPREDVLRRGWPEWLFLATGDDAFLRLPWTASGAAKALAESLRESSVKPQAYLIASDTDNDDLAREWVDTLACCPPVQEGHQLDPAVLDALEARVAALMSMEESLVPGLLGPLAESELRLVTFLINSAEYNQDTGTRLHTAAATAARLCGFVARLAGDYARAQRFYLAGLRSATTAGDHQMAVFMVTVLSGLHHDHGKPALTLLTAAQQGLDQGFLAPRLAAKLLARVARAHACLGEESASARSLDAARSAMDTADWSGEEFAHASWVSHSWLDLFSAAAAADLDKPKVALDRYTPLLRNPLADGLDPGTAVLHLCRAAEAYLSLGHVDAAAETATTAVGLLGGWASAPTDRIRRQLAAHRAVPAAREFLNVTESRSRHEAGRTHLHLWPAPKASTTSTRQGLR